MKVALYGTMLGWLKSLETWSSPYNKDILTPFSKCRSKYSIDKHCSCCLFSPKLALWYSWIHVTCKNVTISFVQASKFTLLTVTYSPVGLYLARFTTIKSSKPLPEREGIKASAILLENSSSPWPLNNLYTHLLKLFFALWKGVIIPKDTTFLGTYPSKGNCPNL